VTTFRAIFAAVVIATALLVGAFLLHQRRPRVEREQPSADFVRATGKCASCHREETGAIVHEYESSRHAAEGINCLDCHGVQVEQEGIEHRGFTIAAGVTALNCAACHADEYDQYLRSRHAAPALAAVRGSAPFTPEQIAFAERYHPGAVERPPNPLTALEGEAAVVSGCDTCHDIGRPNPDGSIGTCTSCHARHRTSIALARMPRTCGQCHMGPDHSQLEIYEESKHGVLFESRRDRMDLDADPQELTVEDMPVPTCATCHMSGLGDNAMTHDVTGRLSWFLFAPVSERRPGYLQGQDAMKSVCRECHTEAHTERFYERAEEVLAATNDKVHAATEVMDALRADGLLTPAPFDEPIEFLYFDYWHYYGRTAKHGAFMGGADFVQWHGNYELLALFVELEHAAEQLRSGEAGSGEPRSGGPRGGGAP
jgi:hypothetical protein